ncbi:leucine-rich repeat serine/threonine-protein kinase 1 isoform X1 [Anopheles maculipalpis]|uniref:leucine-rich repeat serine/threonine-protein kinase 1 isoform X1 n=1 Tax=Anopheles maculipalpis TaxID=1496333 RepID=UPI002158A712|nr:leucine-rich repeat serine/threonine-protein kinase 1 isoform X1 [Anopheles maculipalpis]
MGLFERKIRELRVLSKLHNRKLRILKAALWDNVELLEDLLQEEVHLIDCLDSWGRAPIHAAAITAESRCLPMLINAGANINATAGCRCDNKTALHFSAEHGHVSNIRVLLDAGASFIAKDRNGLTALDLAERSGHEACVQLLKDAADTREQIRSQKHRALREAVTASDEAAVQLLLENIGSDREIIVNMAPGGANTLLFIAAQTGSERIVQLLLEAGADGRAHAVTKYSPLYTAVHNGHTTVASMLLERFPELVQHVTVERWLPFHAACINGHCAVVELLIKYPYIDELLSTFRSPNGELEWRLAFDPNAQDVAGQTALYVGCLLGNPQLVETLLKWRVKCVRHVVPSVASNGGGGLPGGSNSNKMDDGADTVGNSNSNPLSPTSRKISFGIQSIMSRLSLSGRTEQSEDGEGQDGEMRCPLDLDILCGAARETALLAAVRGGFLDVVTILLENGADPNVIARAVEDQNDPKSSDEIYGFSNVPLAEATRQKSLPMVELLLKHGARDDQSVALSIAVQNGDEPIICRLLSIKAHPDPDYKINKRAFTGQEPSAAEYSASPLAFVKMGGNFTYSSLFPSTATMINWHSNNCRLGVIRMAWLSEAVLQCNRKLRAHPKCHQLALAALTRIDISHNTLTTLPADIFNLGSLRYLNAAQNKIERLPVPEEDSERLAGGGRTDGKRRGSGLKPIEYQCPVLEELYLQDNRLECVPAVLFRMPNLAILDVSNNKLQELPFEMWKAPKLKELNVAFNFLKDLPSLPITDGGVGVGSDGERVELPSPVTIGVESGGSAASAALFHLYTGTSASFDDGTEALARNRHVSNLELVRHHIWARSLEVTEQELRLADSRNDSALSQLSSLNLANNLFTSIPLALPCLAVNLTRLNMSYNSLRSMGHVTSYPASLKQLDLGHNEISCWPSLPRIAASDPHLMCYNPQEAKKHLSDGSGGGPGSGGGGSGGGSVGKSGSRGGTGSNGGPGGDTTPSSSTSVSTTSYGGTEMTTVVKSSTSSNSITSLRTAVLKSVCCHRRHLRLESLRTLVLADNSLTRIQLSTDDVTTLGESEDAEWSLIGMAKSRLIFPNLSMLDISNNCLKEIPPSIHELTNLSVLNLSGNMDITELPPHMGLLSRLWNLNTRGCSLQDPLRSMIESKKYKTMDIVGYLKSVYEDARPYARMKLMVVGVQGIGKTSLLEQLRSEGSSRGKKPVDHWAKRMGHRNINQKTSRGINMSTVGVDIGDWVCEKKVRGQSHHGPVVFRTWDFGGQREYYATHQYFLSKRSLYLVLWRIIDGRRGLAEVLQWLGNIQARAPNSPVIIVGTHYDAVGETLPAKKAEELQQIIRDRFIAVSDAEKIGLPRVLDSIEVSCRTGHNIKLLAGLIYDTAFSLRPPGCKEPLLYQRVPASYLALEDVVANIAASLRQHGADPVLDADRYRQTVTHEMQLRGLKGFRDWSELNQATMFLHDNGVLLHYDDATLRDLYFLDPQWLCDMLAHVVTVREINPFARTGVMKMDDLQHVFKSSCLGSNNNRGYIVSLLNKFEVALSWDARTLLIPSLLPTEEDSGSDRIVTVKIATRSKGWVNRARRNPLGNTGFSLPSYDHPLQTVVGSGSLDHSPIPTPTPTDANTATVCDVQMVPHPDRSIARLLLMSYFPSGFWSRLITRVLADDQVVEAVRGLYPLPKELLDQCSGLEDAPALSAHWAVWQTGLSLHFGSSTVVFKMREISITCPTSPYRNPMNRFKLKQDGIWCDIDLTASSILEIHFPCNALRVQVPTGVGQDDTPTSEDAPKLVTCEIEPNIQCLTQLLALTVDHIDLLLEDWYPTLGTRFVHTSEGRFLVTRLVPCPRCLRECEERHAPNLPSQVKPCSTLNQRAAYAANGVHRHRLSIGERRTLDGVGGSGGGGGSAAGVEASGGLNELPGILHDTMAAGAAAAAGRKSQDSLGWSDCDSGVGQETADSSSETSIEGYTLAMAGDGSPSYSWMVEECILAAYDRKSVSCPIHGEIELSRITPDVNFMDLPDHYLIRSSDINRGPLLGRGAFGFVFKATCKATRHSNHSTISTSTALAGRLSSLLGNGTNANQASGPTINVAMKMLQPVAPGPRARQSAIIAYKGALGKWERDPLQHACKAYCTARQELAVLLTLRHPHIVPLIGVCTQPLALVLDLAPKGALDAVLRHFRRSGARIGPYCFQALVLQAAKAMEYLHRRRVIYRDLKAENILVWEFPEPHAHDHPTNAVHIKVADYGISRITLPSGSKGFGGTEGFMAPEIMRHNGEEEYTEKVDCFSFGMFLYELISLRQPFEGHEAVKECILEGGRPVLTHRETHFPSYCLDLMVLCWDQQPKLRPSASQIVSIATAPEFTHLLDVISLSHGGSVMDGIACMITSADGEETGIVSGYELWLPCSNSRIDILGGSAKGWQQYHRILCPQVKGGPGSCGAGQSSGAGSGGPSGSTVAPGSMSSGGSGGSSNSSQPTTPHLLKTIKLTTACAVESAVWIGDAEGNIYAFNAADCVHLFSYALEPSAPSPVVALVYLKKFHRVAAGLENGRLFLLDSTLIPSTYVSAEGSFVLSELGSGERLCSVTALWLAEDECELWCGERDDAISVFSLRNSHVSGQHHLTHFPAPLPVRGLSVALLYASGDDYVYSYLSPSYILYQWRSSTKRVENKLDCSKLVPCSESLKSIAIDERLSPGKCQISALAVLGNELYVGTTWGCIIVVERSNLRPTTVFRPFEEDVRCIIPVVPITPGYDASGHCTTPLIVTIGRGYRSLIERYTDVTVAATGTASAGRHIATTPTTQDKRLKEALLRDRSNHMHALIWSAEHWAPI